MKICIPIVATSIQAALTDIREAHSAGADLIELRIDFLDDLSIAGMEQLIRACSLPIIITPRLEIGGGLWNRSESERSEYFKQAIELSADFIDVEYKSDPQILNQLLTNKKITKIIISHHDWTGTPRFDELWQLYDEIMKSGADIGKIVTKANSVDDNLPMLEVVKYARKQNSSVIGLCMGELGKMTRITSPMLGSLLTYASLEEGKESALGQLTIQQIKNAWKICQLKDKES